MTRSQRMAPQSNSTDTSSVPLADYFFICGLESSSILQPTANGSAANRNSLVATETINEDGSPLLGEDERPTSANGTPVETNRRSARFSYDARKSIGSVINLESKISSSNRSSATIKANQINDGLGALTQPDFEETLRKFATERDSFLEDIRYSSGQVANPDKPRPKPKTQRIVSGEARRDDKGVGSIRRRLSTMNPLSKSSTTSRRTSARNSKRLSGYNSVIAAPQRFQDHPNMHPLKRPYEPVLLDQYPPNDMTNEAKRRSVFPDYVPMFVFPNDINIVSLDERPRSTWHGFAMTNSDGSKLHGMCIINWMPLHVGAAEELERQCEDWRSRNMSNEEREMAKDLGERLGNERAKLSMLLSELPLVPSGTAERDILEEEISSVEERITLMTNALRPVRHGAASKIDGLTDGDSGFWIPRAYGVLGRDPSLINFWKEWLRAISVPMSNGSILRIPASSPRVGIWQPLERYVLNLCTEAPSPISSMTQVELAMRDLRMYARKEAFNEIPGWRNTNLYPLFRCLDVPDIVVLFEYVLSESRTVLLSSHTSMLQLACAAITQLLYPLKWCGVYIPVLPARLIQALEAPCPYIVGIERRYEGVELPSDDFVLVDLDNGIIEATAPPIALPRQQRRKLMSILQLAAAHQYQYGVPLGPPAYVKDAYPSDSFPSENQSIFSPSAPPSNLSHLASLGSASFGAHATAPQIRPPLFNAFLASRNDKRAPQSSDRPMTGSTQRENSPPSMPPSPASSHFPQFPTAGGSLPRNDSAYALQASLREKRSGVFEGSLKRNSSVYIQPLVTSKLANRTDKPKFGLGRPMRRPSFPMHQSTSSITTLGTDSYGGSNYSNYAPSIYAQSTLAASTVMPNVLMQPVRNTETTTWSEGHCLKWQSSEEKIACSVCDEKADDGVYKCTGCGMNAHARCTEQICLVCPVAFHPDQVMAAFVRCFASLFYTYRKHLSPATAEQKKSGQVYRFNMESFLRSVPHDNADYIAALRDTQAFNQFISEREHLPATDPSIRLFDEIILAKRNRGTARSFFSSSSSSKNSVSFIADVSDHLWHTAQAGVSQRDGDREKDRDRGRGDIIGQANGGALNGNGNGISLSTSMGRMPANLDNSLMREPRFFQGVPQVNRTKPLRRKQVPSMLGPNGPVGSGSAVVHHDSAPASGLAIDTTGTGTGSQANSDAQSGVASNAG